MGSRLLDVSVPTGVMEVADLEDEDEIEVAGVARIREYGIKRDAADLLVEWWQVGDEAHR